MRRVIVVTAAAGPTGTAVVRGLRARSGPVRAVVSRRWPRSCAGRLPRTFAEHLADLPLRSAA